VNAQRKIEHAWNRARQQAEQLAVANKTLSDFTDSVANNLRTPLWRISGFCDALDDELKDEDRPAVRKYLRAIGDNTRQMNQLINDTLRLTSLESKPLAFEQIDMTAVATRVADGLRVNSPRRSVEWRIEPDLSVTGDRSMIEELIYRLLDNAWKFSSIRERSVIEVGREGAAYYVRDNGIGFDPSLAEAVFGPYQRTGTMASIEGAGLGLAIARIIVKRHGGQIRAESHPERGTTIRFTLHDES
jgi:signal transduction histidine kinase